MAKMALEELRSLRDTLRSSAIKENKAAESEGRPRIALRNCGAINPESMEEYIAAGGYEALEKALFSMTAEEIVEEVKKSGLRGRGGAGFPTGLKWEAAANAQGEAKYVVCNADEGDPAAYKDRAIIEGDPHSILEAMAICAKAIGARQGFIYIRAEYERAVERLKAAVRQARDAGLLGKDILGSGFDFDMEIRLGEGLFVCGEETALLRSIEEGKSGAPTLMPPYPTECGLWGKPTVVNNVETLANIPVILARGAEWFGKIGTEDSKGTKVFVLSGKANKPGLVEMPMGTTAREIVFGIGGGVKGGKKFKAVLAGGPLGGILSEKDLDAPVDFGSLKRLGASIGSGCMIVMDEDDCVVDAAKSCMEFCLNESCGRCASCRIGTRQIHALLEKISRGEGEGPDLDKIREIAFVMQRCSLCVLGQSAPNVALSTLAKFEEEYIARIADKRRAAGKLGASAKA